MGAIIHHMLDRAPAPVAPFSHAVETDGWVFVTGQIPENPENVDQPLPVGIEAQTRRVMERLASGYAGIGGRKQDRRRQTSGTAGRPVG